MSVLLSASALCLQTPDHHTLLSDFTLSFSDEITGVVGPNGAGKSTLLSVLAGRVQPASGHVHIYGKLGWMAQFTGQPSGSLAQILDISDDWSRLQRIQAGCADEADFDQADWTLETRAQTALARMGLTGFELDHPLETLSGGQCVRAALAGLWLTLPNIVLMDEPTNNLDAEGRQAVMDMMDQWQGGMVIASHDRVLLERVDQIVALEKPGWSVFGGGWSDYVRQRDARLEKAHAALVRAEADLQRTKRNTQEAAARLARRARVGKAQRLDRSNAKVLLDVQKERSESTSRRLSSLSLKREDEAQKAVDEAASHITRAARLNIKAAHPDTHSDKTILKFDTVCFAYGHNTIVDGLSFILKGGERLAVEGGNGAGKTTVLKLAMGMLEPQSGDIHRTHGRVGWLDQSIGDLDPDLSVVEALCAKDHMLTRNSAYAALAQFDLRNTQADKPVRTLSGGERLRAGLASAMGGEPPDLIVLDEPTNHLDIEAIEALQTALSAYKGAILAVSHDPTFLNAIAIERRISLRPH